MLLWLVGAVCCARFSRFSFSILSFGSPFRLTRISGKSPAPGTRRMPSPDQLVLLFAGMTWAGPASAWGTRAGYTRCCVWRLSRLPSDLAGSCRFLAAVTALSVQIPCKNPGVFLAGAVILYNLIDPNFKHFHKILGRPGVEALYQGEKLEGKPNFSEFAVDKMCTASAQTGIRRAALYLVLRCRLANGRAGLRARGKPAGGGGAGRG